MYTFKNINKKQVSDVKGQQNSRFWNHLALGETKLSDSEDFFSMQDMQPHLCEYLDICCVPQQEVCRMPVQQSAYLESK